jgi:hypothetical protein
MGMQQPLDVAGETFSDPTGSGGPRSSCSPSQICAAHGACSSPSLATVSHHERPYPRRMSDATGIPAWAAIAALTLTPLLAFAGVLIANAATRRGAKETENRSRREETMRNLRWAAELALDDDGKRAQLGLNELEALETADMLDDEQKVFVTAALNAVVAEAASTLEELDKDGEEVIVELAGSEEGRTALIATDQGTGTGVDSGKENGGDDGKNGQGHARREGSGEIPR